MTEVLVSSSVIILAVCLLCIILKRGISLKLGYSLWGILRCALLCYYRINPLA